MPLILQSTIGGFGEDFLARIGNLETAMEAKGLDPASFILSKDAARFPVPYMTPGMGGNSYDYTVFFKGESFTMTLLSDGIFLDYFARFCLTDEDDVGGHIAAGSLEGLAKSSA